MRKRLFWDTEVGRMAEEIIRLKAVNADMLAALKGALDGYIGWQERERGHDGDKGWSDDDPVIFNAKQAIAKAEGRQHR